MQTADKACATSGGRVWPSGRRAGPNNGDEDCGGDEAMRAAAGISFELRRRDSTSGWRRKDRGGRAQGPRKRAQLRGPAAAGSASAAARDRQRRRGTDQQGRRVRAAAGGQTGGDAGSASGGSAASNQWAAATADRWRGGAADLGGERAADRPERGHARLTSNLCGDGEETVRQWRCGGSSATAARVSGGGGGGSAMKMEMGLEGGKNGFGGR
ncbi:hypothetical protein Syun_029469 [Stephania yunnanensis]|uniref:Uncharacterized protein n=1 Tax=Stephania yunnanensis TaxID=152371 RepID=A0AAP0HLE4_9MAGN